MVNSAQLHPMQAQRRDHQDVPMPSGVAPAQLLTAIRALPPGSLSAMDRAGWLHTTPAPGPASPAHTTRGGWSSPCSQRS